MAADISVTLGVDGKSAVIGSFQEVGKAGKELGDALMEHTKKLAEMYLGFESLKKVVESFKQAMDEAAKLNELSDQTGIAVDKLGVLGRAFELSGQQADDMGKVVNKMQKYLVEASDNGSEAAYHIAGLGLSMSELKKLSPDQQLEAVGKAVASISDPSERAAASMAIFGKSGGKLMELFTHFDEKVEESKGQLGSYSGIMGMSSEELEKLGNTIEKSVGHKMTEFAVGALSNVTGGLQGLADIVANFDAANFGKQLTANMGEPLKAFANDLKEGNFKAAWEVALATTTIYAEKMGNEIMRVLKAAFVGVGTFALESFATDAPLFRGMYQAFADAGKFIFNTLKEAFLQAGTAANAWVKLTVAALRMDLPSVGLALAELKYVQGEFSTQVEKTSKSYSDIADDAMAAAEASYKNKENFFDTVKSQKELNELIKKQNEETAKHPEKPATETASTDSTGGGGGSGIGGASWKAKMAPIIDPASINTGLYKNTQNMGLDMQELLAGSSMGITSAMGRIYDSRIATAQRTGNFEGAASLMRERAERTQAMQEHDLAVANGAYGGSQYRNRAEANGAFYNDQTPEAILKKRTEYYQKVGYDWWNAKQNAQSDINDGTISDSINKTGGPSGNGSSGAKASAQVDPMEKLSNSIKSDLNTITSFLKGDYMRFLKDSLPVHALS
jgi:methyl-accepting chemotaxis protein